MTNKNASTAESQNRCASALATLLLFSVSFNKQIHMRRLLTLLLLTGFTFASCKKDGTTSSIDARLAGQWEMISVKDNATNEVFTKPTSVSEDIDIIISFTSSTKGNISGALTIATSVKGSFSIDQNKGIVIPSVNYTY